MNENNLEVKSIWSEDFGKYTRRLSSSDKYGIKSIVLVDPFGEKPKAIVSYLGITHILNLFSCKVWCYEIN